MPWTFCWVWYHSLITSSKWCIYGNTRVQELSYWVAFKHWNLQPYFHISQMAFHLYHQKKTPDCDFHTYAVTKEHDQRALQSSCRGFFWKADLSVKSQLSLNEAQTGETHHPHLSSSCQMSIHIVLPSHKQTLSEWEIKTNPVPAVWESKTTLKMLNLKATFFLYHSS